VAVGAKKDSGLWVALAVAGLLAGAGLRFADLGRWTLWPDELASARRSLAPGVAEHLRGMKGNHPLFEVAVLRPWSRLTSTDAGLRIPSAVAGVLTLPVAWGVARMFGPQAAALCVWFLALSPLHLMYSRMARPYALATLWAALATWAMILVFRRARPRALLAWTAASAALALTNLFGLFLTAGQLVFAAWFHRRKPMRILIWAAAAVAVGMLVAPWLAESLISAARWSQETTYTAQQAGAVAKAPYLLFVAALGETVHPLNFWVVAPAVAGFGLCAVGALRQWRRKGFQFLLFQLAAVAVGALVFRATAPKHMLVAAPAFAAVIAAGALVWRPRWLRATAIALALGAQTVSVVNYFAGREFHDADMVTPWREIVAAIAWQERDGDALLIGYQGDKDVWRMFMRYYTGRLKPVWIDFADWRVDLKRRLAGRQRAWLLLHEGDPQAVMTAWLTAQGYTVRKHGFQMEEHTLRGLREGWDRARSVRSHLYTLILAERRAEP